MVKHADGEYIKVGEYNYNPAAKATITVDVAEQEMKAFISVTPPGRGGADPGVEEFKSLLQRARGEPRDPARRRSGALSTIPRFGERLLAAEGVKPANGADARIVYNFQVQHDVQLKEKNGRVDFKELDLVQNVVAGQVVARKEPRGEGTERPHRDRPPPAGQGGPRRASSKSARTSS